MLLLQLFSQSQELLDLHLPVSQLLAILCTYVFALSLSLSLLQLLELNLGPELGAQLLGRDKLLVRGVGDNVEQVTRKREGCWKRAIDGDGGDRGCDGWVRAQVGEE